MQNRINNKFMKKIIRTENDLINSLITNYREKKLLTILSSSS